MTGSNRIRTNEGYLYICRGLLMNDDRCILHFAYADRHMQFLGYCSLVYIFLVLWVMFVTYTKDIPMTVLILNLKGKYYPRYS